MNKKLDHQYYLKLTLTAFFVIFTLYVLYASISLWLNTEVCIKYGAAGIDDMRRTSHYALLVMAYAIVMLFFFLLTLFRKNKASKKAL